MYKQQHTEMPSDMPTRVTVGTPEHLHDLSNHKQACYLDILDKDICLLGRQECVVMQCVVQTMLLLLSQHQNSYRYGQT